jgi:two-component system response regulator YesN
MDLSLNSPIMKRFILSRMDYLQQNFVHPPFDYEREMLWAVQFGDENEAMAFLKKIHELEGATLAVHPLRSRKNALIASCTLFTIYNSRTRAVHTNVQIKQNKVHKCSSFRELRRNW